MPRAFCITCKRLYDVSTASGKRCPPCQAAADRQRDAQRGTTAQRGYGGQHQRKREQLLAAFEPGQACVRCSQPIWQKSDADLGHTDDRQGYTGLEHSACNRRAGAQSRRGNRSASRPPMQRLPDPAGSDDDDWIGIA